MKKVTDSLQAIGFLAQNGYKSFPVADFDRKLYVWNGQKRLPEGSPLCDANEYKIGWNVFVSDWEMPNDPYDRKFESVMLEICAEKDNQWFKLQAYGIGFSELETELQKAENALLRAWEGICK